MAMVEVGISSSPELGEFGLRFRAQGLGLRVLGLGFIV